ncbi:MAG: RsmB/NOP family class I SAM-dependent RNA methyltransferase, partial [Desulfurococcaceae archaeon]
NSCLEILDDNGILVYTTCSIAPEENEYVVSKIIETRNDVEVVKPSLQLFKWSSGLKSFGRIVFNQSVENCVRIWPHLHNMIGLTICILSKKRY